MPGSLSDTRIKTRLLAALSARFETNAIFDQGPHFGPGQDERERGELKRLRNEHEESNLISACFASMGKITFSPVAGVGLSRKPFI